MQAVEVAVASYTERRVRVMNVGVEGEWPVVPVG